MAASEARLSRISTCDLIDLNACRCGIAAVISFGRKSTLRNVLVFESDILPS